MARYLLADFVVDIENQYDFLQRQCAEYEYNGNTPADLKIRVTDEERCREQSLSAADYSGGYLESVCAYRKLCMQLPLLDAMLLHGSVISCKGRGIAFLARSGVGKTTHTMLWKRVYGEQVRIINGDKPIIRFFDGVPFAYGTPWAGKERLQSNTRVQLTDICLIERSPNNSVSKVRPADYLGSLMQQVLHPSEPAAAIKSLELLDRLLSACNFWVIKCNVSDEAAIIAHDTILGENEHEVKI
jgi:hypothetical protein